MQLEAGLYLVSTPIGNMLDITLRAIEVLKAADIVLSEDTRVTSKLLAKHKISARLQVYNDKSSKQDRDKITQKIKNGAAIALVSDAGTPLISDPGYKLVQEIQDNNLHLDVLPGACAPIAALSLSGLPTDSFFFGGFLPKTREGRAGKLTSFKELGATLIFFESPSRLAASLASVQESLGDRQCVVARELTKLYQEARRGAASELLEHYEQHPPKGEIVLLISGKSEQITDISELEGQAEELLEAGISARDAAAQLYEQYQGSFSKKQIYELVNRKKT